MTEDGKIVSEVDDTISTEEDIPGSSISISIIKDKLRIKPKIKFDREPDPPLVDVKKQEPWWVKKSTTQLDLSSVRQMKVEVPKIEPPIFSPDTSSSTNDFEKQERICEKEEAESKSKEDALTDLLASIDLDNLQPDNAEEDLGSILEKITTLAESLSPKTDIGKSKSIEDILKEEQSSVDELIKAAEKLVQDNGNNTLLNNDLDTSDGLTRVRKLETDIFGIINQQANEINGNIIEQPLEIILENLNDQTKKFDDQKAEVSSNSDIDDPISRHSVSEDIEDKKANEKKDSLKKEITDVEKDFFDDLLRKAKEGAEQLSLHSSNINQEGFSHLLSLLQEQNEKDENNKFKAGALNLSEFDPLKDKSKSTEKNEFLEKELVNVESQSILFDLESPVCQPGSEATMKMEKLLEESSRKESSRQSSRCSSKRSSASAKSSINDAKKLINDKNEMYTVGLTPRLELFADAIPKLIAEKSNENSARRDEEKKSEKDVTPKSDDNEDFSFKNFKALDVLKQDVILKDHKNVTDVKDFKVMDLKDSQVYDYQGNYQDYSYLENYGSNSVIGRSNYLKTERVISAPTNKNINNETYIGKSRSYDQLSKPTSKLGSSLENIKTNRTVESRKPISSAMPKKAPVPKMKVQPKTVTKFVPKSKMAPKVRREPVKPYQNEFDLDVRGNQIRSCDDVARNSFGGGDWKDIPGSDTLEMLYQEERQRFMYLKIELEAEIETYKSKLKDVQLLHEQEMFSLKKHNILLKAKVDELFLMNKKSADVRSKYDPKIILMQKELERQENLISAYETENKKLIQETKRLQNELKSSVNQEKSKSITVDNINNNQELFEKLKDLQEESVKLNLEISDLRHKNNEISLKNEDVVQQNSLLQEELEMIKDQLRAKNDFITDRLQAMTTNELELRKQVEDLKVELHSKTEQLKFIQMDYERYQQTVEPIEKELLDLRQKCTYYQEKLQSAKLNCEREKQLTQKLKDQVILDNKSIMDLNRQVREMERILKRKNPDSVSALIITANSEHEKLNIEKVKLLEDRIVFLENEIKIKEEMSQIKLSEIQKKFTDMRDKYSSQVVDLEQKIKVSPRDKKVCNDTGTQTMRILESRGSEPNLVEKLNGNKAGPKSQNLKEDTHLIATIRGLKLELNNKDKTLTKATKELQELQKTNRKLQKEREKLLTERRNLEKISNRIMTSSDSKLSSLKMDDAYDPNSNFYQNGHLNDNKKSSSTQRLYDPQINENSETTSKVRKLTNENEVLKEELSRLNKDLLMLKNKRLQDLNLLQEEHEKEITLIVKEYSTKSGDTKALKLQNANNNYLTKGQVNSQMAMISHLKQQIEKLQDYKEQVIILKAERDHLEGKSRILNEKVKYLSTPSSQQLQLLQDKITILQQRHETRELSLQKLVRDLLRNRSQGCKDCKGTGDQGSKQQLCYFRQELDNILGTLQDLTSP